MNLSVVTTLFQSAPYVEEFYRRATVAAKDLAGADYEIVFVNDGSPDSSLEIAIRLSRQDSHVVVIDLSRNFGHHRAMMTGLAHATGDRVLLIDSDLEEDPAWVASFDDQMRREDCDVVYGVQSRRNDKFFSRLAGATFYRIFRLLTRLDLPNNVVVMRLMTRRYVDALLLHDEREVFLAGLWVITGYRQVSQTITKSNKRRTTYNAGRKIAQFINSITSFSDTPLIGIFVCGIVISILASLYTTYIIINWLFLARPISGWTSVMASIWLLGGATMAFMGVIGIYISKIFLETKRRPYSIVRHIYGRSDKGT